MTKQEIAAQALANATSSESMMNYPAIFEGFISKGIPGDQIEPRVNVFTYNAWLAKGRQVRKGEHGVKVITWITVGDKTDDDGNETEGHKIPKTTTVFHISQTDEASERPARGNYRNPYRQRKRNFYSDGDDPDMRAEADMARACGLL